MPHSKSFKEQGVPILLTIVTFFCLIALLYGAIYFLNLFPSKEKIHIVIRPQDITVGLTIYLKTAIDFAILIGNLMKSNPGWKKRIAIELGTALGNGGGTLVVLALWNFFREIPIIMAIMIFLASLVLLRMAEESLHEFVQSHKTSKIHKHVHFLTQQLRIFNAIFHPVLGRLIPSTNLTKMPIFTFWSLGVFSFTIPFILGLDDFAGYIPLFSIINVFGFAIGVFLGHMLLNVSLFISPKKTVSIVSHPAVLILGGLAFVGIAGWGLYEVFHILETILYH